MSTEAPAGLIFKLLPLVMADIGAIAKDQKNTYHDYKFRGIDDVLNAIHPSLARHQVSLTVDVADCQLTERIIDGKQGRQTTQFDCRMKLNVTFWAPDGSSMSNTLAGHGLSNSDDKAIAKCNSSIYKQIMFLALAIPVDDQLNPDSDTHQVRPEDQEERATSRSGRTSGRASRPPAREQEQRQEGPPTQETQKHFADDNPHGGEKETASKLSKGKAAIGNCHTDKQIEQVVKRAKDYLLKKEITPDEYSELVIAAAERSQFLTSAGAAK